MVEVIFIELLERGGRVAQRLRFDRFPITVGRAYGNDVIVDDRYVSPQHLQIDRDADGTITVQDLDSLNGTLRLAPERRVARTRLADDMTLKIGGAELRFRTSDHRVEPAELYAGDGAAFKSPRWAALAVAVGATYLFGLTYLHAFQKVALVRHVALLVPLAIVVLLWSLAWSVAARVLSHHFRFMQHCAVAVLAGVALSLLDQLTDYYAFAFNAESSGRIIAWGGLVVILTCLLYAHTRLCAAEASRRLLLRTAGIAALVIGLGNLARFAERNDITEVPSLLKPPAFRVARARSVEEFLEASKGLQKRVDDLAHEKDAAN